MNLLQLFTIDNVVGADKTQLSTAFLPVKTWNLERAARMRHPSIPRPDIPDNADIAGPDSIYDYYV